MGSKYREVGGEQRGLEQIRVTTGNTAKSNTPLPYFRAFKVFERLLDLATEYVL